MTLRTHFEGHRPVPRVVHCPPGSFITLAGDTKPRIIDHIRGRHAICTDGLIVSLCYPVRPECMKFGDGDGWRPLINKNCA